MKSSYHFVPPGRHLRRPVHSQPFLPAHKVLNISIEKNLPQSEWQKSPEEHGVSLIFSPIVLTPDDCIQKIIEESMHSNNLQHIATIIRYDSAYQTGFCDVIHNCFSENLVF
ncbi:hypothetical protein D3C74_446280 [compost metagenome]